MCGITGFADIRQSKNSYDSKRIIECMTDVLKSRGPDDKGIWIDKKDNICLGHRRLSIIELSNLGKQPMTSHNNRFVIIYNGEISIVNSTISNNILNSLNIQIDDLLFFTKMVKKYFFARK